MIQATKRCLKRISGQAKFSQDELLTAITEVEMVINSRPISYMSASDLEEPLTPCHLMIGRRLMDASEGLDPDPDNYDTSLDALNRRTKYLNFTIYKFWERWSREYLLELREVHKQCEHK